jgi:hypothetical protein
MAAMHAAAIVASDMSDIHDLPFELHLNIDGVECPHSIGGVGTFSGDAGMPVSAFNSSI